MKEWEDVLSKASEFKVQPSNSSKKSSRSSPDNPAGEGVKAKKEAASTKPKPTAGSTFSSKSKKSCDHSKTAKEKGASRAITKTLETSEMAEEVKESEDTVTSPGVRTNGAATAPVRDSVIKTERPNSAIRSRKRVT